VKAKFLMWAEIFDTWRIVPRLFLVWFSWFVSETTFYLLRWYTHEPKEGRGTQETAVLLGVTAFVAGLFTWVFKVYVSAGRQWHKDNQQEK
jgi:hypothetical protein